MKLTAKKFVTAWVAVIFGTLAGFFLFPFGDALGAGETWQHALGVGITSIRNNWIPAFFMLTVMAAVACILFRLIQAGRNKA